jgi:predicted alpha/beta-hydrolase family hydrolase
VQVEKSLAKVDAILAQSSQVLSAPASNSLTATQTLTSSLTAESLIFASFTVAYNLAQPTAAGRHPFFAQGIFAYCIVLAILAVAVSAGASLIATWPASAGGTLRAAGLVVAIVAQPIFALLIAQQARRS